MKLATNIERNFIPKSRTQAIEQGAQYFYPDEACSRGHRSLREAIGADCLECVRIDRNANTEREEYHRKALKAVSVSIEQKQLRERLKEVWE